MGKLQNKTAVITGGNSGVGAATALLFAKSGHSASDNGRFLLIKQAIWSKKITSYEIASAA